MAVKNTLEGTAGTDWDILISVSKNDGSLWSAPAVVHSYANHDDAGDLEPEIATNGNGTWIITWRSSYDTGFIGSDTDILMSMSNNDGETWSSPTAINSSAASDNFLYGLTEYLPLVVSNGADTWVVAWNHFDGNVGSSDKHLQYTVSHDNGLSWSLESQLSNSPIYYANQSLSIASNGTGTWIATWETTDTHSGTVGTDFDIMYSISSDDARSWSAPFPLNHYAATDGGYDDDTSPSIATDRDGNWFVVWRYYHSSQEEGIGYSISQNNGTTWSSEPYLAVGWPGRPRVASGGGGKWTVLRQLGKDLEFTYTGDDGNTWRTPMTIVMPEFNTGVSSFNTQLIADRQGKWMCIWPFTHREEGITHPTVILYSVLDIVAETDGDVVPDYDELSIYETDPDDADSDNDGLTDGEEIYSYGTNPLEDDSDNDGYSDSFEVEVGSNPLNINDVPPPNSEVWLSIGAQFNGDGSEESPFNDIDSSVTNIAVGGRLHVVGGVINTPYTFTKKMSLR